MAKSKSKQKPEYELKHRITGAAIMVALAVIVIPLLLKEPGIEANVATDAGSGKKTFKTNIEPLNLNTLKLSQTEDDPGDDLDNLKPALLQSDDVVAYSEENNVSMEPKLNLTIDESPESSVGSIDSSKEEKKQKEQLAKKEEEKRKEKQAKKKAEKEKQQLAKAAESSDAAKQVKEPENDPEPEKTTEPEQVAQPVSISGWTVRVGTFTKQKNVDSVSDKLNNSGFNTHHTKVETTLGSATRVWLGPYESKETAEKVSARLKTLIGEKGYVTKHAS